MSGEKALYDNENWAKAEHIRASPIPLLPSSEHSTTDSTKVIFNYNVSDHEHRGLPVTQLGLPRWTEAVCAFLCRRKSPQIDRSAITFRGRIIAIHRDLNFLFFFTL